MISSIIFLKQFIILHFYFILLVYYCQVVYISKKLEKILNTNIFIGDFSIYNEIVEFYCY